MNSIELPPACEYCEDEKYVYKEGQVGEEMRGQMVHCICWIEKQGVRISKMPIMEMSRIVGLLIKTPPQEMVWHKGRVTSPTLPSAFLKF